VSSPLAILAVGGLDPSGHAGLAADLRAGASLGVLVAPLAAALTVQGGDELQVQAVDPGLLARQLEAVSQGLRLAALKVGLLPSAAQVQTLAAFLRRHAELPVVLDPVLAATRGGSLVQGDLLPALRRELLPLLSVLTPNLDEAAALLGRDLQPDRGGLENAARDLLGLGPQALLLKGGHLGGAESPDLYADAQGLSWLEGERIDSPNTRGTGCSLATLIAVGLAQGLEPLEACAQAKARLSAYLKQNQVLSWPQGPGPVLPA
jgi:hydroxymethylpyrimidine/phosphomethylpyrimidine kinase